MAEEGHHGGSGVDGEIVLQGGEVCVPKFREELIPEDSIDVTTFAVLSKLFGVLTEKHLCVEGVCPCRDVECATGVGQADERVLGDEGVLGFRQDENEVTILAPAAGTLN